MAIGTLCCAVLDCRRTGKPYFDRNVFICTVHIGRACQERDLNEYTECAAARSIEQDADMVWFVYREAYYVERSEPREGTPEHMAWLEEMDRVSGLADVIIAKQRHGPIDLARFRQHRRSRLRCVQPAPVPGHAQDRRRGP